MTHICVGNRTIIGSDNGLSPGRRQAITWTNVGILLIGPLGTNFSEMLIEIHTFSFKKIHLKMSSGKWRPFCLGLNVLKQYLPPYPWSSTVLCIDDFSLKIKGTVIVSLNLTQARQEIPRSGWKSPKLLQNGTFFVHSMKCNLQGFLGHFQCVTCKTLMKRTDCQKT